MSPQSYSNILQMIGHTPLVAVTRLDTGPCRLFLKLENQNPGGSLKDRIGLYLIEAAERDRWLDPSLQDRDAVTAMLRPSPAGTLVRHPVDRAVNTPRNDGPEIIIPVAPDVERAPAATSP